MFLSRGINSKESIPLANVAWQIRKTEAERTLFNISKTKQAFLKKIFSESFGYKYC
jgi:hypothetical protein